MTNASRGPRVSIGMPVYNREKYVAASIECHLNQTYPDFELVITDNCSTDGSEQICRDYAAKDSRVKYFRNSQNLGASGNFRRCFELSTGEFFRWSPSDDLVSVNLLQRALEVLDADPSVFVAYGRTRLIDAAGKEIGDFNENLHLMQDRPSERWKGVMRSLKLGNLHYGLYNREIFRKTGLLRNFIGGDFPLIAEMSLYGKFYEIPDAFFYRRMHEEASSAMKTSAAVMAFFDPKKSAKRPFMYSWRHLGSNLKSVHRSHIPFSEKLHIYAYQARLMFWDRRQYLNELVAAARYSAEKTG